MYIYIYIYIYIYPTFCDILSKHACLLMDDMPTYTKSGNSNLIKKFKFFCNSVIFE